MAHANKNIILDKSIVYQIIVTSLYLIICDILLFFCCNIDLSTINYIHILLFNISFSLFVMFIYYLCDKKYRCIVLFTILILLDIIYVTEILIYNTFSNFFSLRDIFNNAHNVFIDFGLEVRHIVSSNIVVILYFILLDVVLYISLYKLSDKMQIGKNQSKRKNIYMLIVCGCAFVLSMCTIDKAPRNFNMFLSRHGLKSSIFCHPLAHNDYDIKIDENVKVDDIKDNIEDDKNNTSDYKKHMWDIEFDTDLASDIDMNYLLMNGYVKSIAPTTENAYTGLFNGKNLIMLCAEAFSVYAIDEKLTPTLYRLYNNGFKFTDFYQPCWYGGTSGGEYSLLTGLVPTDTTCSTLKAHGHNMGLTIFNMLKKDGYVTSAFHNGDYKFYDRNISHDETLGFDNYLATGNGLEEIAGEFCGDDVMLYKTFPMYSDKTPFAVYYMTLTGHAFYNDENYKTRRYLKRVKERYGDKYSKQVNYYLCAQLYLEEALKLLIEKLEYKKMMDDTVICIVPDHYPYGLTNSTLGNPFTDGINYVNELYDMRDKELNSFERDKNAWLLWCGSLEKDDKKYAKTIDYPTFSLDVLPTLLNLFGIDYDSRLLVGNDVFSDYEHLVFDYDENFITDDVMCFSDGIKIYKNDKILDEEKIKNIRTLVHNKILFSKFVLDNDYYNYIYSHIK